MIRNGTRKIPGLLAVLAMVPDPQMPRGRRYPLVFVLAVAAACTLAGAKTFREIGDRQLTCSRACSGTWACGFTPLRRKIIAPSETRIRTLLHLRLRQQAERAAAGTRWTGTGHVFTTLTVAPRTAAMTVVRTARGRSASSSPTSSVMDDCNAVTKNVSPAAIRNAPTARITQVRSQLNAMAATPPLIPEMPNW
jgi:DDE_Tnp_1-associated